MPGVQDWLPCPPRSAGRSRTLKYRKKHLSGCGILSFVWLNRLNVDLIASQAWGNSSARWVTESHNEHMLTSFDLKHPSHGTVHWRTILSAVPEPLSYPTTFYNHYLTFSISLFAHPHVACCYCWSAIAHSLSITFRCIPLTHSCGWLEPTFVSTVD